MGLNGISNAVAAARGRHQEVREEVWPGTAVIDGTPYGCSCSTGERQLVLNEDGTTQWATTMKIGIKKTVLATPPPIRKLVTVGGTVYKLIRLGGLDAHVVAWELVCVRGGG